MKSELTKLTSTALAVRRRILTCLFDTGGGHYGGSLSVGEILVVLGIAVLGDGGELSRTTKRDKLILSKGHAAVALYATYVSLGLLEEDSMNNYGTFGAGMEGHPDMLLTRDVDFSTGSLGQGVSAGAGMAIVLRQTEQHVWVVLGDGECQEGQVWEAAMFASRYCIRNLHVIVDLNGAQEIGWQHDQALPQEPLPGAAAKWRSFGWIVHEVDGHDLADLRRAIETLKSDTRGPSVILARTKKGKGVKKIEDDPIRFHCVTVNDSEHQDLLAALYA